MRFKENFYKPVVWFRRRNGVNFSKRFSSRKAAARAVRGWRSAGGRVVKVIY